MKWYFAFIALYSWTINSIRYFEGFLYQILSIALCSYLNSWERASIFPFQCWVLNRGTTGTIFITSLVWRGPWLGIEPGPSAIEASTLPLGYRGGGDQVLKWWSIVNLVDKLAHVPYTALHQKTTGILNYRVNFLIKLFYVSFRFKYVRATGTSMSCFVYHTMSSKVVARVHCNLKQVFCHATQVQSIWYRKRKLFRRWRLGKTCSGNSTHLNSTLSNFCFWILWQINISPR